MRAKWYITTCILSLAFLGLFVQPQQVAPNQELVLQFNDATTSQVAVENTIAYVQEQLVEAGASNIKVRDTDGLLKITYFSDVDVEQIKEVLLSEAQLASEDVADTSEEQPQNIPSDTYNFDVYELLNGYDVSNDFEGNLVLETKIRADRFYVPSLDFNNRISETKHLASCVQVTHKFYSTLALNIDTLSRNVPEVRAGPSA